MLLTETKSFAASYFFYSEVKNIVPTLDWLELFPPQRHGSSSVGTGKHYLVKCRSIRGGCYLLLITTAGLEWFNKIQAKYSVDLINTL